MIRASIPIQSLQVKPHAPFFFFFVSDSEFLALIKKKKKRPGDIWATCGNDHSTVLPQIRVYNIFVACRLLSLPLQAETRQILMYFVLPHCSIPVGCDPCKRPEDDFFSQLDSNMTAEPMRARKKIVSIEISRWSRYMFPTTPNFRCP